MSRNAAAWLEDIREAGQAIQADTADLSLDDYLRDQTVRRATERNFQIIGEALVNLRDQRPDLFARIDRGRRVIDFRNVLVHAYFELDHSTVWDVSDRALPHLLAQAGELLNDLQ